MELGPQTTCQTKEELPLRRPSELTEMTASTLTLTCLLHITLPSTYLNYQSPTYPPFCVEGFVFI